METTTTGKESSALDNVDIAFNYFSINILTQLISAVIKKAVVIWIF